MQHTRASVIIVGLLATGLIFACIPPPTPSEASPIPSQRINVPRCVLDSVAAVTLTALPAPRANLAAASLMSGVVSRTCRSPLQLAAATRQNHRQRYASAARERVEQGRLRRYERQAPAAAGTRLVDTARKYRGVRYRWAGMSSRGMDCSGFIARVLKANGIRAPHNSARLYGLGRPVRFEELQPGDLLFFSTRRRGISHVGMYVGDNQFIHASSGAGRVVTTSIYDRYYQRRLVGARRLEKAAH